MTTHTTTTRAAPPPGMARVDREEATRVSVVVIPTDQIPSLRECEARGWTRLLYQCDACREQDTVLFECAECMGRHCDNCDPAHEHLRYDLAPGRGPSQTNQQ